MKTFINHVKVTRGVKKVRDIVEFIDINYSSNYNSKFGGLIAQNSPSPTPWNVMNIDKLK